MANCPLCCKNYGVLSGGEEAITGKKLKLCRSCWTLLTNMETAYQNYDEATFLFTKSEIDKKACTAEAKIITDLCEYYQQQRFEVSKKAESDFRKEYTGENNPSDGQQNGDSIKTDPPVTAAYDHNALIQSDMAKDIKAIKNMLMFFVVLTIIQIVSYLVIFSKLL
ncbi:MAG: hypothetical protein ACRC3H_24490 [Lachnospiraceae bacterium]